MAGRNPIELPFPLKGLNEGWAYRRQPPGTTPDALNVRALGQEEERLRGGQRPGISKAIETVVAADTPISALGSIVRARLPGELVATKTLVTDTFGYSPGVDAWLTVEAPTVYQGYLNTARAAQMGFMAENPVNSVSFHSSGAGALPRFVLLKTAFSPQNFQYLLQIRVNHGSTDAARYHGLVIRAKEVAGVVAQADRTEITLRRTATNVLLELKEGAGTRDTVATLAVANSYVLRVENDGTTINIYVDGELEHTVVSSTNATNNGVGMFGIGSGTPIVGFYMSEFLAQDAASPARLSRVDLVAVAGVEIFMGEPTAAVLTEASGTYAIDPNFAAMRTAYGVMYFCDGSSTGYLVLDPLTNTVATWTPTAGTLPVGADTPTLACKIITLYRGRIVLSGLIEEPHNWYMSAVGDPLDWDYGVSPITATMAVAGNNSDAGELGDIITALAPYSDDMLLMGGDHTLWVLRGDPAAGGVIDNLSYQVGINAQESHTFDPNGTFYFFGNGEIWRMQPPSGYPESVSGEKLRKTLADIDTLANKVHLIWNPDDDGLHVYVVPIGLTTPTTAPQHFYWDKQTDSWWKDEYPLDIGPSFPYFFHSASEQGRGMLLGGWDGYIRKLDADATTDDGTNILSHVDLTPLVLAGDMTNTRLTEIVPIIGLDSDPVVLEGYAAESVEAVVKATTPRFVRTLAAGRNASVRQRINGNAIRLRLKNATSGSWTMESMTGVIAVSGKTRHGRL